MAVQFDGRKYFIRNVGRNNLSAKDLNVLSDASYPNDGTSVTLASTTNISTQRWFLTLYSGIGCKTFTEAGSTRALNIVSLSNPNCTIWHASGSANNNDSMVDLLTVNRDLNRYRIKLVNYNLYLTVTGATSLSYPNVEWKALNGSNDQVWDFIEVDGQTPPVIGSYTNPTASDVKKYSRGMLPEHPAIDIVDEPYIASDNVPIYAFADGYVSRKYTGDKEGNTIRIKHGKLFGDNKFIETRYLHLKLPAFYSEGKYVYKGDIIGYMGSTGNSTGEHLHFEIAYRTSSDFSIPSNYYDFEGHLDPLNYLTGYIKQ